VSKKERVSAVFYVEKPRYSGEHWRVIIAKGAFVSNYGFTSEEAAIKFHNENKENK
jgi:hypothetical protein